MSWSLDSVTPSSAWAASVVVQRGPGHVGQRSDALNQNSLRMRCNGLEVLRVGRENGAPGLCHRNDDRVQGRAATRPPSQQRGPSCESFGDTVHDIAGLEQLIGRRIASGVALQALHQDGRRHNRGPKTFRAQREHECN